MKRSRARILVVGAGGLGCPSSMVLARAGVGSIDLLDDDVVSLSNIHRQILFSESDVGQSKVDVASRRLEKISSSRVRGIQGRLVPESAMEQIKGYDLVVEGSDNFATKFLAADACSILRIPIVHAAAVRWHGTVLAVGPHGGPCYRCIFEDIPRENAPNCAEAGVMGPVCGIVGALQADLALSILDLGDNAPFGTLITFDGARNMLRRRVIPSRVECFLCGNSRRINTIDPSTYRLVEEF